MNKVQTPTIPTTPEHLTIHPIYKNELKTNKYLAEIGLCYFFKNEQLRPYYIKGGNVFERKHQLSPKGTPYIKHKNINYSIATIIESIKHTEPLKKGIDKKYTPRVKTFKAERRKPKLNFFVKALRWLRGQTL